MSDNLKKLFKCFVRFWLVLSGVSQTVLCLDLNEKSFDLSKRRQSICGIEESKLISRPLIVCIIHGWN